MPHLEVFAAEFYLDVMEFTVPTGAFRIVAEGVVALSIGGADCHGSCDVIAVIKSQAAGFLGEVLHGLMRIDGGVMGIGKLFRDGLRIVERLDGLDQRVGTQAPEDAANLVT